MDEKFDQSTAETGAREGSCATACRHCGGSGKEPSVLEIQFSRSGPTRGELAHLADLSGVSDAMISSTLSGHRTPSIGVLVRLAAALTKWMGEPVTVERIIRIPAVWKRIQRKS